MRKLLIGGSAVVLSAAFAAAAIAQGSDTVEATAKVTPTRSGTDRAPKKTTVKFSLTNKVPNTTAKTIVLYFAKDVEIVPGNLKACDKDELELNGPSVCPSGSKAGATGTAVAFLDPTGNRNQLNFKVTPYSGGRSSLLFWLEQQGGEVKAALEGKIKRAGGKYGQKMTIKIPENLQQPAPGVYSALDQLANTFTGGTAKKPLLVTTGCPRKAKRHIFGVQLIFTPNPTPPPVSSVREDIQAKCS